MDIRQLSANGRNSGFGKRLPSLPWERRKSRRFTERLSSACRDLTSHAAVENRRSYENLLRKAGPHYSANHFRQAPQGIAEEDAIGRRQLAQPPTQARGGFGAALRNNRRGQTDTGIEKADELLDQHTFCRALEAIVADNKNKEVKK